MNIIRLGPGGLNVAHMIEWVEPTDRPGVVRVSMLPGVWREFDGDAARKLIARLDLLDRLPLYGQGPEQEIDPGEFEVSRPEQSSGGTVSEQA